MKVVWQDEIELYLYCRLKYYNKHFTSKIVSITLYLWKQNKQTKNKLKEMPTGIPRSIDQPKMKEN